LQKKENLFHETIKSLSGHVELTHERKVKIWENIKNMSSNSLHHLNSYLTLGPRGWTYVKTLVLPGFSV
jgi:hypothetical protein